jgi:asparaginyl-tRNA synthetase
MKLIFVKDVAAHLGEEVTLRGWVRNIRHSGKLLFIILRDGTGELQCVAFQPELGEEMFDAAKRLTMESSLIVTGIPKPHQKLAGTFELSVKSVKSIQIAEEYPIGKKKNTGPISCSQTAISGSAHLNSGLCFASAIQYIMRSVTG